MKNLIFILFLLCMAAPASAISSWKYELSVPTLAERVLALEKEVELRAQQQREALHTATIAMEKRLDGMNEFRDTLRDQAGTFVTRTELLAVSGVVSTIITIFLSVIFRLFPMHCRENK